MISSDSDDGTQMIQVLMTLDQEDFLQLGASQSAISTTFSENTHKEQI